ncbi:MAG: CHAT domain-containing protein [Chloroflexaceae bacterium]|nr:CHAT domain-containing protein [Chloroflexaceae bacterium]
MKTSIESLRLSISRSDEAGNVYYSTTLQQPSMVYMHGGPLGADDFRIPAARLQHVRQDYHQQVEAWHQRPAELQGKRLPDPEKLLQLGNEVAALLPHDIRQRLGQAVQRARQHNRRLHIMLEVEPDAREALAVPWELLALPVTSSAPEFLLRDGRITLIRQVRAIGRNTPPTLSSPLSIQAFGASPAGAAPVDLALTGDAIKQLFGADCWYAGANTLAVMQQRLLQHNPQVIHLLCHGDQQSVGRGYRHDVLLQGDDGFVHRVNVWDLLSVFSLASANIQVIVLQACHAGSALPPLHTGAAPTTPTQAHDQREASEGIALTLLRQGIPVVVAMQGEVSQEAASTFVSGLYAALRQGKTIEAAVAAGRVNVAVSEAAADWSLPVLYQGSGEPDPDTWFSRLADRWHASIFDPGIRRSIRGWLVFIVIMLFGTGFLRWLAPIPTSQPPSDSVIGFLQCWTIMSLLTPLVVGTCHRGARRRDDIAAPVRRAAIGNQWTGAFVGHTLAGVTGMTLLLAAWTIGLFEWLPWLFYPLCLGLLLVAAFVSYASAKAQGQSAIAQAATSPSLFDLPTFTLMIGGMLLVSLAGPWYFLWLSTTQWLIFLTPAANAIALALLLLLFVLLG